MANIKTGSFVLCKNCQIEFYRVKSKEKREFCSVKCFHQFKRKVIVDSINPEFIRLFRENKTCEEIGTLFNVSPQTVLNHLRWAGEYTSRRFTGKNAANWNGVGRLGAGMFSRINPRNKEIKITLEDMWAKFLEQNGKCALTGIELILPYDENFVPIPNKLVTASLDRIDSKKGYIRQNIQWIHKYINIMKNSLDQKSFIQLCNMVARFHPTQEIIEEQCLDFRQKMSSS